MALGDVTGSGHLTMIELLATATSTNSPPSGGSAGIDVQTITDIAHHRHMMLLINSSAGSATMTVTCRIWGYNGTTAVWSPIGTGAASAKGVVNAGAAIAEDQADLIRHAEVLTDLTIWNRLYLEITAIGGTATAVAAHLAWGIQDT